MVLKIKLNNNNMIPIDIYGIHHDIWKFANEIAEKNSLNIDLIDLKQYGLKTTVYYENNVIGWIVEDVKANGINYTKELTFYPKQ